MGTSVSQRSPQTPNWQAVGVAYESPAIPVERITQELWRASISQPIGDMRELLSAPLIAACANTVVHAGSAREAVGALRRQASLSGQATIGVDLAQRAAATCYQETGPRLQSFVERLFYETTNYLVSRDLPGHIGEKSRLRNVSTAANMKAEICNRVGETVRSLRCPSEVVGSPAAWRAYVDTVVKQLAGGNG
jgi:hypothetical protein